MREANFLCPTKDAAKTAVAALIREGFRASLPRKNLAYDGTRLAVLFDTDEDERAAFAIILAVASTATRLGSQLGDVGGFDD